MIYNDIKKAFDDVLNIPLTPNITITEIYREYDRKPNVNFIYFKESYGAVEQGCTTSITIEVNCVFENELLALRCRDEVVRLINENNIFSLIGNHEALYSSGVIEYDKSLFISPIEVRINLL